MGSLIKEAAEKQHLHKGAFGLWRRLHKMGLSDPTKLATFLAHFDYYRGLAVKIGRTEHPSLDDRARSQLEMFDQAEAGEAEDGEESNATDQGTPPGEKDARPRFQVHDGERAAG